MTENEYKEFCKYLNKNKKKPENPKYCISNKADLIDFIKKSENPKALYIASESLYNDKELNILLLKETSRAVEYLNPVFFSDPDVMCEAINQYCWAIDYVSPSLMNDKEFAKRVIKLKPETYEEFSSEIREDSENLNNALYFAYNVSSGLIHLEQLKTVEQFRLFIKVKPEDYAKVPECFKKDERILKYATLDKVNQHELEKLGIDIKQTYIDFLDKECLEFVSYNNLVKFNDDEKYVETIFFLLLRPDQGLANRFSISNFFGTGYRFTSIKIIKYICSNSPISMNFIDESVFKNKEIMLNIIKPALLEYNDKVEKIMSYPIFIDHQQEGDSDPSFLLEFFKVKGKICVRWFESYVSNEYKKRMKTCTATKHNWNDYLNYLISLNK